MSDIIDKAKSAIQIARIAGSGTWHKIASVSVNEILNVEAAFAEYETRVEELETIVNGFVINEKQINDPHFEGVQARLMDMARKALDKEATK